MNIIVGVQANFTLSHPFPRKYVHSIIFLTYTIILAVASFATVVDSFAICESKTHFFSTNIVNCNTQSLQYSARKWSAQKHFITNRSSGSYLSTNLYGSDKSQVGLPDTSTSEEKVKKLLQLIDLTKEDNEENSPQLKENINTQIIEIESDFALKREAEGNDDETLDRFEKLIGLYSVAQVITKNKNENPVGGKWTRKSSIAKKLFESRRTFQHILQPSNQKTSTNKSNTTTAAPIVAEAVNVISFDALFGLSRITVMLRGDALPLSLKERQDLQLTNYAVRANFDPPRIVFGKRGRIFNINLGPKSSVILDATYVDDCVRIGKGGTSGSRFVFKRCNLFDDEEISEANEYKTLLARNPMRRSKMVSILLGVLGLGAYNLKLGRVALGTTMLVFSGIGGGILKFSTGGIEDDEKVENASSSSP